MRKNGCLIIFFFFCIANVLADAPENSQRLSMDRNWKFILSDPVGADKANFDDTDWRTLNLPHDWSIEGDYSEDAPAGGSGGYLPTGIGWYRRHFNMNKSDLNKKIWIEFDGIYMNSDVWINEHHLGNHPYGYTSFYYNLTSYLKEGENIVAVRVDNSKQPNTRWYSGSGIYRHVWLVKKDPLHIDHWGVYAITPEVSINSAKVEIKTKIENNYKDLKKAVLQSVLFKDGKEIVRVETLFTVESNKKSDIKQELRVDSPKLWSIETPELYELHSIIKDENGIRDEIVTDIGIRNIKYDTDKGFLLNGKHVKMNGVCLHHDGGCVGAAVPIGVWSYRLEKLKEMGCNAIRTSHNPPAPEFLDLCDKLGFLVMDEAFDEWESGKRKYGYHIYFDEWSKSDLISMLKRDRNHPSIVLWSVGNEIPDQKTEEGTKILNTLTDICHQEDSTRPVTSACDNIAADGGSTALSFLNKLDIVGYNYVDRWHERRELYYSIDRHDHPDWKMIGTESVSNGGIRGSYSLSDSSMFRMHYNTWMIRPEQLWKFVKMHNYVVGDFMWTGIDYLGESFWPFKNGFFGAIDLCGFPKDGYYFYQSQWSDKPVLHLFPHWNLSDIKEWNVKEGDIVPVLCYTNCDTVELFLNGKSFGEKRIEFPRQGTSGGWNKYAKPVINATTSDLHLEWDLPYEPGVLKAVGKKDGKIVIEEILTAGKPAALRLSADRDSVNTGEDDVSNVKVEVVDSKGNIVPTADNIVNFYIEGEGKIIGVDNGNPMDHNSYKSDKRNAFNGLCLAVIQPSDKTGSIKLTAKSEGLKEASIKIYVRSRNPVPSMP